MLLQTFFPILILYILICRFAMEYAPLGDLTSNFQDGKDLGETYTKRVTHQIGQGEKQQPRSKYTTHASDFFLDNYLQMTLLID